MDGAAFFLLRRGAGGGCCLVLWRGVAGGCDMVGCWQTRKGRVSNSPWFQSCESPPDSIM